MQGPEPFRGLSGSACLWPSGPEKNFKSLLWLKQLCFPIIWQVGRVEGVEFRYVCIFLNDFKLIAQ